MANSDASGVSVVSEAEDSGNSDNSIESAILEASLSVESSNVSSPITIVETRSEAASSSEDS